MLERTKLHESPFFPIIEKINTYFSSNTFEKLPKKSFFCSVFSRKVARKNFLCWKVAQKRFFTICQPDFFIRKMKYLVKSSKYAKISTSVAAFVSVQADKSMNAYFKGFEWNGKINACTKKYPLLSIVSLFKSSDTILSLLESFDTWYHHFTDFHSC